LYPTAILFAVYLIIVIFGYLHWRKLYNDQTMNPELSQA
jgi:hypothetical protein